MSDKRKVVGELVKEYRSHLIWDVLKETLKDPKYLSGTIVGLGMAVLQWIRLHRYTNWLFLSGLGVASVSLLALGVLVGRKLKAIELAASKADEVSATNEEEKEVRASTSSSQPGVSLIRLATDEDVKKYDPKYQALRRAIETNLERAPAAATSGRPKRVLGSALGAVLVLCVAAMGYFLTARVGLVGDSAPSHPASGTANSYPRSTPNPTPGPFGTEVLSPEKARDHAGEYSTVCGVAADIKSWRPERLVLIYFDKPHGFRDFRIEISGKDLLKFSPAPKTWLGKEVCVAGIIRNDSESPTIVLDSPKEITVRPVAR